MTDTANTTVVLQEVGRLVLEQRAMPMPGAGEVQVRVEVVTICGSDVHYYERGRIADFEVTGPLVLGHETSGVVSAVGAGVAPDLVGVRVALEPGVFCGHCVQCTSGHYNLCPDMAFYATPPHDGALQQYVTLPAHLAHPIPDELSFEHAALIEPLAVAVMACRRARLQGGERVLVTGAGAIGVLCAQVARVLGAGTVWLSDVDPARLQQARAFGVPESQLVTDASDVVADVLVECSGAPSALRGGIAALRPGGLAVAVGFGPDPDVSLPLGVMQIREVTLTSTFRYANAYPAAIAFAADGRVQLDGLIGASFPLARAEAAMRISRDRPEVLRAAVYAQR
ncbi:NAD(P)-dependent alcohol dehydrogenase [Blastococcus sp. SYSU DS0617]